MTELLPLTVVCLAPALTKGALKAFASIPSAQAYLLMATDSQSTAQSTVLERCRVLTAPQNLTEPMDYGQLRQHALQLVKTEWVLFLDSDEWLGKDAANQLSALLKQAAAGYALFRRDHFWGRSLRFGEAGYVTFLRLARTKLMHWQGRVHETAQVMGKVRVIKLFIQHQPHADVATFNSQVQQYARLAAASRSDSVVKIGWEMATYPLGKFLLNYLIRSGWRDGAAGLCYAILMSWHSFLVRAFRLENKLCATHS